MDDKFQNLKVMVIDDSKTIRRTAETLLQREGCEVVTAVDGFDALSKIAQANPDTVFFFLSLKPMQLLPDLRPYNFARDNDINL